MKERDKPGALPRRMQAIAFVTGLFLLIAGTAAGVDLSISGIEMASRGAMEDGGFGLSSMINADLALTGGDKYALELGFTLEARDVAKAFTYRNFKAPVDNTGDPTREEYNDLANRLNNQAYLGFRIAKASVMGIFGLPLDLSYFIGQGDNFCTGDEFPSLFGVSPFATDFRGFFYFPTGIGGDPLRRYNGIYGVRGTGLTLGMRKWDNFVPMLYLYQDFINSDYLPIDSYVAPGKGNLYSGDLRLLFNLDWLKIETFGGFSANTSQDLSLRGGLMAHITGDGVEFFVQAGIPGFTAWEDFDIDSVFFLMEPRLRFENFGINLTFFYHPVEYIHILTPAERGIADINIKFIFGHIDTGLTGGVETGAEIKTEEAQDYVMHISPFLAYNSGGLRWDFKIRVKPLSYDTPKEMVEFFLGVRTVL